MKPEKPITRKEMYLDVATGGSTELPSPVTREEKYLAKIAGESVDVPTPVTRYEMLLAAVAGESYTLAPVTRLEIYLAKAAGQDVEIPQPVTREEMYWFDYCGGTPTPPEREYTGAVPVTFVADGQPLIDYIISGNTAQSGTPTPDSPIMPQGTGERTGNLWNEEGFSAKAITSTHEHTDTNTYGTTLSTTIGKETIITQSEYPTGTVGYQNGFFFIDVDFSKYEIGDKVTLSFDYICNEVHSIEDQISTTLYAGKNSNIIPVVLSSGKWSVSGRLTAVITVIADMNPYVEVRLCGNSITVKNIMLNSGSTALPYEPYGVKIPISSAGQTTPVYLGEVQTTRKIRKLVLTGEETIPNNDGASYNSGTSTDRFVRDIPLSVGDNGTSEIILCTHLGFQAQSWAARTKTGCCIYCSGNTMQLHLRFDNTTLGITQSDTNEQRTEKLKAYLAAQYANGTPVTVWYVLATEETAVVNEPLMRIGNYTDTLSMEQAGVQIPTANGSTTLDVDTTVKPSEVYIKYRGEAVATLSALPAEVSSPEETPEEVNPEETEETENGSEDVSLQHEFEAIE